MLKKLNHWKNRKIKKPKKVSFLGRYRPRKRIVQKTRVSFWATTGAEWINKDYQKIHDEILKIEDDLQKIRMKLFDLGNNPEIVDFRKGFHRRHYSK